jgi:hypothetical protein
MPKHRLVVVGDSMSQGFMSGAIHRTDISCPVWIADALGIREHFMVPNFEGCGGLPVNLEQVLRQLSDEYGKKISWYEALQTLATIQHILDRIEDYWERGRGTLPDPRHQIHHNLASWGFEVGDALTLTEGICRSTIPEPKDHLFKQVPEYSMYRTASRVLNPSYVAEMVNWTQIRTVEHLARRGGIENLIITLGANNALGTVTSLSVKYSEETDLDKLSHERKCNLYIPRHFNRLYEMLIDRVEALGAKVERVFLGTVPHVTIPPVSRGVGQFADGYYDYYTRPWVWDSDFDPDVHPKLTRIDAQTIDSHIDQYNKTVGAAAKRHKNWFVVDLCGLLDELAFRRQQGQVRYKFPAGLVKALRRHKPLSYLVDKSGNVSLDTRFFMAEEYKHTARVKKGGLFSLDGIHPTTIGCGLMAHRFVKVMRKAGVQFAAKDLDWGAIVRADTLVNRPPLLLDDLHDALTILDRRGLLSKLLELF